MAAQQESGTAETLAGGVTESNNPETLGFRLKLDDIGNFGSGLGVHNGDSIPVDEHDGIRGINLKAMNNVSVDRISLLVQVNTTLDNEKETDKKQVAKSEIEPLMETSKKGDATGKAQNEAINKEGAENEIEGREDGVIEQTYSVGDFVWGKIKSHPWWPGRIYDPSDASEFAIKYKQTSRLLVAYYGDGSFSWCLPSQLKPFAQNFEEMSKQSTVKSFLNAVNKALDEIGTLVELEMTCQCVAQKHSPLAVNAGIKTGVLVPKAGTCKLSLPSYEPQHVLFNLRDLGHTLSFPSSRLELVVFTSWLSGFYYAKGGYQLSRYCNPSLVEGLEDKATNLAVDRNDFTVPIEVPIQGPSEEEWAFNQYAGSVNCPVIADDKLYHHTKQRSMAKLMGASMGSDVQNESDSVAGMKESEKDANLNDSAKNLKKRKALSIENGAPNDVDVPKEESQRGPLSRERKKSKYLSPPYTSPPRWITGSSRAKGGFEDLFSKTARVDEGMTKTAAEVSKPLPVSGHDYDAVEGKNLEKADYLDEEPQICNENHEMKLNALYVNTPISQILLEVQSTAINPLYLRKTDMIRRFASAFRKCIYTPEPSYKVKKGGRKIIPMSLIVTFSPGHALPSKEEVVTIFSRYGVLNEKETNTNHASNCLQVVYENGSDAEAAFREAIKDNPFAGAHVNYRLRHSSDSSRGPCSIKQNLNVLKSMLKKCNGKISQEEKLDLEIELKGLLEKVSTMDAAP